MNSCRDVVVAVEMTVGLSARVAGTAAVGAWLAVGAASTVAKGSGWTAAWFELLGRTLAVEVVFAVVVVVAAMRSSSAC